MAELINNNKILNIGFISTRFSGTDGVSLETEKWAEVLGELGHKCFYFCGKSDRPEEKSMVFPEAFYKHPEIKNMHNRFFQNEVRSREETNWIHEKTRVFKERVGTFLDKFAIDLMIVENALSIPLNIPLGLAITELISETRIPVIAHHHDFAWERKRFLVNSIGDYLDMAFPPSNKRIHHVVINTHAQHQLARRSGVGSVLIPNVMNYDKSPPEIDEYNQDLRKELGISEDETFILQPTRIVERKGIEQAIELVSRLERKVNFVVSHAAGDEGDDYAVRVREYADLLGVKITFAEKRFDNERGTTIDGKKIYNIADGYLHADLVTYPSEFEGFGNAFLESVYYKKPIVVNNYSIYSTDIRPKGFKVIEFDDYITDQTVDKTKHVLDNEQFAKEMVEKNFQLAKKHFSYSILRKKLGILFINCFGTESQINGSHG